VDIAGCFLAFHDHTDWSEHMGRAKRVGEHTSILRSDFEVVGVNTDIDKN